MNDPWSQEWKILNVLLDGNPDARATLARIEQDSEVNPEVRALIVQCRRLVAESKESAAFRLDDLARLVHKPNPLAKAKL